MSAHLDRAFLVGGFVIPGTVQLVWDVEASRWFSPHGCAVQLVGTKADKLSRAESQRAASAIVKAFRRNALMTSAASREGIDELWAWIAQQVDQWTQLKR